ncbi:hypothetical protein [Leptolyngbya phage Lbo-JY16]
MTPEVEKKRRSIFEAHIRDTHKEDIAVDGEKIFTPSGTGYDWHWVQQKWIVFNAALDAVEIVFPNQRDEKYQECYDDVEGGCFNYILYLKDVRNAITATGLGLRIKE